MAQLAFESGGPVTGVADLEIVAPRDWTWRDVAAEDGCPPELLIGGGGAQLHADAWSAFGWMFAGYTVDGEWYLAEIQMTIDAAEDTALVHSEFSASLREDRTAPYELDRELSTGVVSLVFDEP